MTFSVIKLLKVFIDVISMIEELASVLQSLRYKFFCACKEGFMKLLGAAAGI